MKEKLAKLVALRAVALALLLAHNFLIVRFLPLDEIGRYYLIATIAYLGNAAVFVGADMNLQRQLATISVDARICWTGLLRYWVVTGGTGGIIVLLGSSVYFSFYHGGSWALLALLCCGLSVATYLSSLGRNLLQLAAHPLYSSLGQLIEGLSRVGTITALVIFGNANAVSVAATGAAGALIAGGIMLTLLGKVCVPVRQDYLANPRQLLGSILPIGGSGLLSWTQLQGYRLLISSSPAGLQVVGAISFMSTLGSAVANASFSVLGQFQAPLQYRSKGETTPVYLKLIFFLTVILALLSLPAGLAFLSVADRMALSGLVYLVALGVILEAGNAAIGACAHHLNALGMGMWRLPAAGLIGCVVTYGLLLTTASLGDHMRIALSLILGQLSAVAVVLYSTIRKAETCLAKT